MNFLPSKKVFILIVAFLMLLAVFILVTLNMQKIISQEPTDKELAEGTGVNINVQKSSIEKIVEKGTLSPAGEQTKNTLIAPLNGRAGVLFENGLVRIYYLPPSGNISESFTSEIRTTNIPTAKGFTWSWLEEKGLTDQDICNLRITFSYTSEVREYLIQTGEEFNPVFDNC